LNEKHRKFDKMLDNTAKDYATLLRHFAHTGRTHLGGDAIYVNNRLRLILPVADFSIGFVAQSSQNLHKLCIFQ